MYEVFKVPHKAQVKHELRYFQNMTIKEKIEDLVCMIKFSSHDQNRSFPLMSINPDNENIHKHHLKLLTRMGQKALYIMFYFILVSW